MFVRHALPGERVRARVTEDAGSYLRADAVEILTASADRVPPPCPHAGPGRCGGCDWQHASGAAQRELKASVVREQFARVAGLDVAPMFAAVEELPGGLLGWRSRITFAVDADGRPGLHRHRSHDLEPVAACPLGMPGVGDTAALTRSWPGRSGIEAVRDDDGAVALVEHRPRRRPPRRGAAGRRTACASSRVRIGCGTASAGTTVRGRRDRLLAGAPRSAAGARRGAARRDPAGGGGDGPRAVRRGRAADAAARRCRRPGRARSGRRGEPRRLSPTRRRT